MRRYQGRNEAYYYELRLFLEELCCNLCRFIHVKHDNLAAEDVLVRQEVYIRPAAYADISIQIPDHAPYFIEVTHGYSKDRLISMLKRKYQEPSAITAKLEKLVLVVSNDFKKMFANGAEDLKKYVFSDLQIDIWDEKKFTKLIEECFYVKIKNFSPDNVLTLREAVDRVKGVYAFGNKYEDNALYGTLIWHFGFWHIKYLREKYATEAEEFLKPRLHQNAVVLLADISSFSSFVRDTQDDDVLRLCLTSFYAKSRYQIINSGGMLYQFVGDEAIAMFGIPHHDEDYIAHALECAKSLVEIGTSVIDDWQRQIDFVQDTVGIHIAMSIGDVRMMSLRPFGRTHMGAVSDSINVGSRLLGSAGPGEIVVSNTYYQHLPESIQHKFTAIDTVEAKNIGRLQAWKYND